MRRWQPAGLVRLLFALGLATALAACGSPPGAGTDVNQTSSAPTGQPWDGLSGAVREHALLDAAKREGDLTVYSAFNDEQAMADAFSKKYGIKVSVYN
ncbi:MAG TPA: hypothetical protein VI029_15400, partial [Mycobacterium sp.]